MEDGTVIKDEPVEVSETRLKVKILASAVFLASSLILSTCGLLQDDLAVSDDSEDGLDGDDLMAF